MNRQRTKAIYFFLFFIFTISLLSCKDEIEIPIANLEIGTISASEITINSAKCGGNIPDITGGLPILSRGVCWGINENPTINDNGYFSIDGEGTGQFTSLIQGLNANTKYYYRAYATNKKETIYGVVKSFTTLSGIISITTNTVTNIAATSATCGGSVTNNGGLPITARGVCWGSVNNPTIEYDGKTTNGSGNGSFSSNITGLTPNRTYYVRAYATNSNGTTYGPQRIFSTSSASNPTITTNTITNITTTSATCGGNITNNGGLSITARGVCWSTTQNPTIYNNKTNNGNGNGSFTSSITGLTPNRTYYVRAYATNSNGTSYGTQRSFNTLSSNLTATTVSATQTGSDYSANGFEYDDGSYYNYKFYWDATFSYSNTQYADTIGFIINDNLWNYFINVSDGTKTSSGWTSWSNSNNATITYQAYAIKNDGTLILGEKKSLYLYYGGKNSSPQNIHLDLNINDNTAIKTHSIKSLDKNINTTIRRKK